jgi:hypothetical protein
MTQARHILASVAIGVTVAFAPSGRAQTAQQKPPPAPLGEDCVLYSPRGVQIAPPASGPGEWMLHSGSQRMFGLDNERDATNALALAQRYNIYCLIGRHIGATKPVATPARTPSRLINYWKAPSGQTTTISPENCTPYDPSRLQMNDKGAEGWVVSDSRKFTLMLDTQDDASMALWLSRQHTSHCVIGTTQILDWWK